jgi:hypothetical protein
MNLDIDAEFAELCREIVAQNRTREEWGETESDDEFQSDHYEGGWDEIEGAFTFSYYDAAKTEYWFQLTLAEVTSIAEGRLAAIDVRPART